MVHIEDYKVFFSYKLTQEENKGKQLLIDFDESSVENQSVMITREFESSEQDIQIVEIYYERETQIMYSIASVGQGAAYAYGYNMSNIEGGDLFMHKIQLKRDDILLSPDSILGLSTNRKTMYVRFISDRDYIAAINIEFGVIDTYVLSEVTDSYFISSQNDILYLCGFFETSFVLFKTPIENVDSLSLIDITELEFNVESNLDVPIVIDPLTMVINEHTTAQIESPSTYDYNVDLVPDEQAMVPIMFHLSPLVFNLPMNYFVNTTENFSYSTDSGDVTFSVADYFGDSIYSQINLEVRNSSNTTMISNLNTGDGTIQNTFLIQSDSFSVKQSRPVHIILEQ